MGQPGIKEIEAQLPDWDFLQNLPAQVGNFTLQPGTGIQGQILNMAAYVDAVHHCRLDLTYTSETFDYVPVKTIGLHVFRDERIFCRDREHFAAMVQQQLPRLLDSVDRTKAHKLPWSAQGLGFDQWEYWRSLPQELEGYQLFITPDNPVAYINGSYIFLDYTDFNTGNQLYFAYNSFRNEIFAEKKQGCLPLTTNEFDVKDLRPVKKGKEVLVEPNRVSDERKLQLFTQLLQEKLVPTLQSLKES